MKFPLKSRLIAVVAALLLALSTTIFFVTRSMAPANEATTYTEVAPFNSFQELPTRISDIRAVTWQQFNARLNEAYTPTMKVVTLVSPNSQDCTDGVIPVVRKIEKVYHRTDIPKKVYILIGNTAKDMDWFVSESKKLLPPKYRSYDGNVMINPETVNDKGEGVLWAEDACNDNVEVSGEDGVKISHGLFHVFQTLQFLGAEKDWARWGEVPRWILEGGAFLTGTYSKTGEDRDEYLKRAENLYELYNLGPDFYKAFLKYTPGEKDPWRYTDRWDNYRAYDVGSYVCEILVALKGPESIVNLYGDYIKTNDFNQSFKNIYGITWNEVYPLLGDLVYKVIEDAMKTNMPWAMKTAKPAKD